MLIKIAKEITCPRILAFVVTFVFMQWVWGTAPFVAAAIVTVLVVALGIVVGSIIGTINHVDR